MKVLALLSIVTVTSSFNFNQMMSKLVPSIPNSIPTTSTFQSVASNIPSWQALQESLLSTPTGQAISEQEKLRLEGDGLPHTDAKLRLFGTSDEPRVLFYRDTAAWCPYCQKVWILLEEKRIPYRIEKINMRSYGDKPQEFLRMVPNGLLPAIVLDGKMQTDSLPIMLNLDQTFNGPSHRPMLPQAGTPEMDRAQRLMRLERALFASWCGLVFRPPSRAELEYFQSDLDKVEKELQVTSSPWFLDDLSIVDLTYITHIERMCASVAYWSGFRLRGTGRWPSLERWMEAFESLPSYRATKSDYYTHVMDIPPQYGPGYRVLGQEALRMAAAIDGSDGSWSLPLPPFNPSLDVEPVIASLDPGDESSRHEAALKLTRNHEAVTRFALRGAGKPGAKRFQAPLADPYATPDLSLTDDMDVCLRQVTAALLQGYTSTIPLPSAQSDEEGTLRKNIAASLAYLRARIGVPRDMSYPAARQLRAHLSWVIDQVLTTSS